MINPFQGYKDYKTQLLPSRGPRRGQLKRQVGPALVGCAQDGPRRPGEIPFLTLCRWGQPPPCQGVHTRECLTQVGGPGALLGPDLGKFQPQVSPPPPTGSAAEATCSSLLRGSYKLKALGFIIACNHLV